VYGQAGLFETKIFAMNKIIVFPTWIIVLCIKPFLPKSHPFSKKWISLESWEKYSTKLNKEFSMVFWFLGLIMVSLALSYFK